MSKENNLDNKNMLAEKFTFSEQNFKTMASGIVALRDSIRKEKIKESFSDFTNVAHRMEFVCKIRSVSFFNDAKSTNVNATWYSLESFHNSIIWIAGGQDNGNDYTRLKPIVKEKVKTIICLGVDNSKLKLAFKDDIELIYDTQCIKQAVGLAFSLAGPNDLVLLSPACSSFDLFENYEDKGNKFKEAVYNL